MSVRQAVAALCKRLRNFAPTPNKPTNSLSNAGRFRGSVAHEFGGYRWSKRQGDAFQWVFLSGQAAFILGIHSMPSLAEEVSVESNSKSNASMDNFDGLRKIEDDSLISNEHTSKWRVFTDNGRDYFMQGNIEQAEKFFLSALEEAKEGFGERDPHVASACNNLAELYRVKRAFDDAEPLYVEAINILEEYFGTDDIRVGAAIHNLGQFYLVQRKMEQARVCYERSLKIKRRVLGEAHTDYADTMYHLGTVLYLQGKEKEAADLIVDSIRILEAVGQGESVVCIRRMQYLAQLYGMVESGAYAQIACFKKMYSKSNRYAEAEILWRKILHMMELSKGWKSLDTVIAAERLALTIQTVGRLEEAEELFERCLEARKILLPTEHVQNAANMLYIARVKMLISNQLMKTNSSQAMAELDMAKNLLLNSIRVARKVLVKSVKQKGNQKPIGVRRTEKEGHSAALLLLQSLNSLGSLEITKLGFLKSREDYSSTEVDAVFRQCISTVKELQSEKSIFDSPEVKAEYLSCLRCLLDLINTGMLSETCKAKEIQDEIHSLEIEIAKTQKP